MGALPPIANFVRWALWGAAGVYANWDEIQRLFDTTRTDEAATIFGYRYVAVIDELDKASGGAWTQRAQYSIAFLNVTSGEPDYTWTTADFTSIESGSEALWTALSAKIPSCFRLAEHRWYAFGPGVTPPNPVYRYVTLTTPIVGTNSGATATTSACACTIKTTLRRHWGRFYLPWSTSQLDAAGRITTANVDTAASAFNTFLKSGSAQGVIPCVYDSARKALHGMTAMQVDDVPDVIRRRRQSVTTYRKAYTS